MNDIKIDIKRLEQILHQSETSTPSFINGLLIPDTLINEFYYLVCLMMKNAPYYKKYNEYIQESARKSQESVDDFVISLLKDVKEGTIKISQK